MAATTAEQNISPRRWDIFCQVIDNFGDVGVCWRTAAELAARGHSVRLWMDDASALQWMAPAPHPKGLSTHGWPSQAADVPEQVGDVVIEAFGCEIPEAFVAAIARQAAQGKPPLWMNLEYLSAESYVERCHRLPSLIMSGPAAGLTRWFFYPGFTPATGGLVREAHLAQRQQQFAAGADSLHNSNSSARQAWRLQRGITAQDCAISLFCYEPPALAQWLTELNKQPPVELGTHLLITPGRATAAVQKLGTSWATTEGPETSEKPAPTALKLHWLTPCAQPEFDEMLWACDLNLVRGEDSLVRALWAGQPFVWHIYPQDDNAHHDKLDAFLDWLNAPPSLRNFHHAWNGMSDANALPQLTPALLQEWQECVLQARQKLLFRGAQSELISQIQAFAAEKS